MKDIKQIILASGSPRRREILEGLGLSIRILTPDADENSSETDPASLVRELSLRKWQAARDLLLERGESLDGTLMIASDTVVACDGEILGKPRDRADAERMMRMLSGREHSVFSGIAVSFGETVVADFDETRVRFSHISEDALAWYLENSTYLDKAGAYAIQEDAAMFIRGMEGDFFNVVGLPVSRLCHLTEHSLGIPFYTLTSKGGQK